MAALKAARDFGLEPGEADAIALRFDPRTGCLDRVLDDLTAALVARGAVDVPASP
jgi:hypothetical protein